MPNLPVNIDTSYADSPQDASFKTHQQHHDVIHGYINENDGVVRTTAIQGVLQRLAFGLTDVNVVVIGDSTGNDAGEWPDLAMRELQSRYPTFSLKTAAWDNATGAYGALSATVGGSGSRSINLYNASVAGVTFDNSYGDNIRKQVGDVNPHLVFVNYGHNDGSVGSEGTYERLRSRLLGLTEPIRLVAPNAAIVLMSQNPRSDAGATANISEHRSLRVRQVAELRGCGFVDVCQAFLTHADPASLVDAGGVHPTSAGSQVWADAVAQLFEPNVLVTGTQQPSSLGGAVGHNLAANGSFASFATPPTLPNWTAGNVALSKMTTNYESPNGYSLRIQSASAAVASISQSLPIRLARGTWITAGARLYIPAGQASTVGRLQLSGSGGVAQTSMGAGPRDEWHWVIVSVYFPYSTGYTSLVFYADSGSAGGADLYVDRIVAVRGQLPKDIY